MNVEDGSFKRCVKHPSQTFTGFCSSCLVERLSFVDSVEKSNEIVEISNEYKNNGREVRVRKTLLSLFQLDDCNDAQNECESKPSTSGNDFESLEDKDLKLKIPSFRSNSVVRPKGLRWRFSGASKSGRFGNHCEIKDCGKDTFEKPRHSWDGSIMSKALTCSFPCLDEPHDGSSCGRIKRRLPEESVVNDSDTRGGSNSTSLNNSSLGSLFREKQHEEFQRELHSDEKKSHRWSRVWDWNITSPFRDFAKKKEHNLERSLSGTWQEAQNKSEPHTHTNGNGHYVPRANQSLRRNVNSGNCEVQKFRSDLQRYKYRFGRSRSVHYPSPGNFDNGLLRFYLTPMRTSRRSSNNGRARTTRLFTMGILGH